MSDPVFCSECKHGIFDDYGVRGETGWNCDKTNPAHPIYRERLYYKSCWEKNKNNDCKDFEREE